jgi:hypothetical protein
MYKEVVSKSKKSELKLDSPGAIRWAAELLIDKFRRESESYLGEAFGYDNDSVEYVENFIYDRAKQATRAEEARLVQLIGAYLGEFMIQEKGGAWELHTGSWLLRLKNNVLADPFFAVQGAFEDSVQGWYSNLFYLMAVMCDPESYREGFECDTHGQTDVFLNQDGKPVCQACHPPISLDEDKAG